MNYSLSGADLLASSANTAVILYPELYNYDSIEDLFTGGLEAVFILYEFRKNVGHWTAVIKQGDTLEHFDSYNHKPDTEFSFIPRDFREMNNMMFPRLTAMLLADGREIHYNNFKLQREGSNIATCGRHAVVRIWLRDFPISEYYKVMKRIRKETGLNFDEIVLTLTGDYPKGNGFNDDPFKGGNPLLNPQEY